MRRAPVLAVLVMLLVAADAARAGAPQRNCLRSGTTVSANEQARLFYVGERRDNVLYVCWLKTERVRKLGSLNLGDVGPAVPVLSGRWVAYDRLSCWDGGECAGRIVVRSAQTGKVLHQAPLQPGRTKAIVLTTSGTAAWIRVGVYKLDGAGVTLLDGSPWPAIDQESLALAGTRAYWLRSGQPASALLDAP